MSHTLEDIKEEFDVWSNNYYHQYGSYPERETVADWWIERLWELTRARESTLLSKLREGLGEDESEGEIKVPEGEGIGEYKFTESLRLEGRNQERQRIRNLITSLQQDINQDKT